MTTYVILSRFSPNAFTDPREFNGLAATVSKEIKNKCPGVTPLLSTARAQIS